MVCTTESSGFTPLMFAATGRKTDTGIYLIDQGADVAVSDNYGFTALHFAAEKEAVGLMEHLLERDANKEANSVCGTPIQCAAAFGKDESVKCLLSHGANPDSVSQCSATALMWAVYCRSYECFELLLEARADPNIDSFGMSPLACAALCGETDFLNRLLQVGASPNSLSTDRLKPIEYAVLGGDNENVSILFPLTERIQNYPNWRVDGIFEYFHSETATLAREKTQDKYFGLMKYKGKKAERQKDYLAATKWYSEKCLQNGARVGRSWVKLLALYMTLIAVVI